MVLTAHVVGVYLGVLVMMFLLVVIWLRVVGRWIV